MAWKFCIAVVAIVGIAGCAEDDDLSNAGTPLTMSSGVASQADEEILLTVEHAGVPYVCETTFDGDKHDCVQDLYQGQFPANARPELYCNGVGIYASCDSLWYPDDLDRYTLVTNSAGEYICDDAFLGGLGDLDCYEYDGGDPADAMRFAVPDTYCTDGVSIDCNDEYYPSEMEGLTFATIDFGDYVCQDTFLGQECFAWNGYGSPRNAVSSPLPDFYCSDDQCSEEDYP